MTPGSQVQIAPRATEAKAGIPRRNPKGAPALVFWVFGVLDHRSTKSTVHPERSRGAQERELVDLGAEELVREVAVDPHRRLGIVVAKQRLGGDELHPAHQGEARGRVAVMPRSA